MNSSFKKKKGQQDICYYYQQHDSGDYGNGQGIFLAGITGLHSQLRVKQHTELTVIQRIRQDLLHQQWLESVQRLEIHSMFMFVPGLSGIWGNERPVRLACLAITTG